MPVRKRSSSKANAAREQEVVVYISADSSDDESLGRRSSSVRRNAEDKSSRAPLLKRTPTRSRTRAAAPVRNAAKSRGGPPEPFETYPTEAPKELPQPLLTIASLQSPSLDNNSPAQANSLQSPLRSPFRFPQLSADVPPPAADREAEQPTLPSSSCSSRLNKRFQASTPVAKRCKFARLQQLANYPPGDPPDEDEQQQQLPALSTATTPSLSEVRQHPVQLQTSPAPPPQPPQQGLPQQGLPPPPNLQTLCIARMTRKRRLEAHRLLNRLPDALVDAVANCMAEQGTLTDEVAMQLLNAQRVTLAWRRARSLKSATLMLLGPQCPNLRSLDLSGCLQLKDRAIVEVLQSCRSLDCLRLAGCKRLSDSAFETKLFKTSLGLLGLRILDISGCPQLSNRTLEVIAKNCPRLEDLKISGNRHFTHEPVVDLFKSCHFLKFFAASQCPSIDGLQWLESTGDLASGLSIESLAWSYNNCGLAFLKALGRSCPRLKKLDLRWCQNVTDEGLRALLLYSGNESTDLPDLPQREGTVRLPYMEQLLVRGCQLSTASVAVAGSLPLLREIDFSWCSIDAQESLMLLLSLALEKINIGFSNLLRRTPDAAQGGEEKGAVYDDNISLRPATRTIPKPNRKNTKLLSKEWCTYFERAEDAQIGEFYLTPGTPRAVAATPGCADLASLKLDGLPCNPQLISRIQQCTRLRALALCLCGKGCSLAGIARDCPSLSNLRLDLSGLQADDRSQILIEELPLFKSVTKLSIRINNCAPSAGAIKKTAKAPTPEELLAICHTVEPDGVTRSTPAADAEPEPAASPERPLKTPQGADAIAPEGPSAAEMHDEEILPLPSVEKIIGETPGESLDQSLDESLGVPLDEPLGVPLDESLGVPLDEPLGVSLDESLDQSLDASPDAKGMEEDFAEAAAAVDKNVPASEVLDPLADSRAEMSVSSSPEVPQQLPESTIVESGETLEKNAESDVEEFSSPTIAAVDFHVLFAPDLDQVQDTDLQQPIESATLEEPSEEAAGQQTGQAVDKLFDGASDGGAIDEAVSPAAGPAAGQGAEMRDDEEPQPSASSLLAEPEGAIVTPLQEMASDDDEEPVTAAGLLDEYTEESEKRFESEEFHGAAAPEPPATSALLFDILRERDGVQAAGLRSLTLFNIGHAMERSFERAAEEGEDEWWVPRLKRLESIVIFGCDDLTDEHVGKLCSRTPSLKDISLINCPLLTANVLDTGIRRCRNLRSMRLVNQNFKKIL